MFAIRADVLWQKFILIAGLTILAGLPSAASANDGVSQEAMKPWINCLVAQSRKLAPSPDSAPVVAAAIMTLCSNYEGDVRVEVERSARAELIRKGVVADDAEAFRVQRSIGDQGWDSFLARMKDQVTAIIVQMRAMPITK